MNKMSFQQITVSVLIFTIIIIGNSAAKAQNIDSTLESNNIISAIIFKLSLENNAEVKQKYKISVLVLPDDTKSTFYENTGKSFILKKNHRYLFDVTYPGYNTAHIAVFTDGMNASRTINADFTLQKDKTVVNNGTVVFDPKIKKFTIH